MVHPANRVGAEVRWYRDRPSEHSPARPVRSTNSSIRPRGAATREMPSSKMQSTSSQLVSPENGPYLHHKALLSSFRDGGVTFAPITSRRYNSSRDIPHPDAPLHRASFHQRGLETLTQRRCTVSLQRFSLFDLRNLPLKTGGPNLVE